MQTELQLKIMPIRVAVKQCYDQMSNEFNVLEFCIYTRRILQKMTMDGTILRRLRELRETGECPYRVIDNINGIYQKVT